MTLFHQLTDYKKNFPLDINTMTPKQSRNVETIKSYGFEAAHYLPNVPDGHKCKRLHGHSFKFDVICKGEASTNTGWLIDFGDISKIVKPLIKNHLDHYCLNDVAGLENPTAEELSIWLWNKIKPDLPSLYQIVVKETCTSKSIYSG